MGLFANVVVGFMGLWCVVYFVVYAHFLSASFGAKPAVPIPAAAAIQASDPLIPSDLHLAAAVGSLSVGTVLSNPFLCYSCRSFIEQDALTLGMGAAPSVAVVLVITTELKSEIVRTAQSIVANSGRLLHSLYVIDDSAELNVKSWTEWHAAPFVENAVKIMHTRPERRLGRGRARALGASAALDQAGVAALLFADARIVVSADWLLPLLSTLHNHPKSVVYPAVDVLDISGAEPGFIKGDRVVAGFGWDLARKWLPMQTTSEHHDPDDDDVDEAISPATHSTFALTSAFYRDIGGYDGSLAAHLPDVELSLRVWLCGGLIVRQPCSRIAQSFPNLASEASEGVSRHEVDKSVVAVSHRWMGKAFRDAVFQARFLHRMPEQIPIALDNLHPEKFASARLMNEYDCLSMDWYLREVGPALLAEVDGVRASFAAYLATDYADTLLHPLIEQYSAPSRVQVSADSLSKLEGYKAKYSDKNAVDREVSDARSSYIEDMRYGHQEHVKKSLACEDETFVGATDCAAFKSRGGCTSPVDASMAMFSCPATCGRCAADGTVCEDFYEKKCPQDKAKGDCQTNTAYMERNCRFSCGLCVRAGENAVAVVAAVDVAPIVHMASPPDQANVAIPNLAIPDIAIPDVAVPKANAFDPYLQSGILAEDPHNAKAISQACSLNNKPNGDLLSRIPVAPKAEGAPRVFCGIYTMEKNHQTQVQSTISTWGRRCDGFVAFSTVTDVALSAMKIEHAGVESYDNMWQKSRSIWKYVFENYLNDFDYFLLGGDDMFYIIENLKAYLNSTEIRAEAAKGKGVYLGRIFRPPRQIPFNSGGAGYLLDRVALKLLGDNLDTPKCHPLQVGFWEDVNVATCLLASGAIVPLDSRDSLKRERFHPFEPGHHLTYNVPAGPKQDWYRDYNPELMLGYNCCSDQSISFHYVKEPSMREFYAYVYHCDIKIVRNNVYPMTRGLF